MAGDHWVRDGAGGATRRSMMAMLASASGLVLAGCGGGLSGFPGLDGGGPPPASAAAAGKSLAPRSGRAACALASFCP